MQQVFLFLMAIIVVIATILLGGKMFHLLSGSSCEYTDAEFRQQLRRTLDEYSTFGSRGTVTVQSPCDAELLCFVDHSMIGGDIALNGPHTTINTVVNSGVETNVFLKKKEGMMEAGYDPRIEVPDPVHIECFEEVRGSFSFRSEGTGKTIKIYGDGAS